ncbi:hypothetical protein SAMN05444008_107223 [Cnuella takakiae]|uniref:Chain length determinant protein n=1 Tax=Cnuella takakiae TaxID=1302690 RepID=A0A1M5BAL4_9BACT|nr:hypothetical protein [Cnuella takakiae]OLY93406.1 hypothetical protein BUE76_17080 [Cnuella takakiae]SHF39446.1 hypothetical protein SAMN05444008_107223 [Cnuella takakiae]
MENQGKASEISLKEILTQIGSTVRYLGKHWFKIFLVGFIGAGLGFTLAYFKTTKYISRTTFVVEESKSGGGGLASLAGQFGVDLGGSSGGGVFSGDNILLFLRSQSLVQETLLSNYGDGNQTLADRYAQVYGLKDKWKKKFNGREVLFDTTDTQKSDRVADSLLQKIAEGVVKNELSVTRPDKKATFVEVRAVMRDEELCQVFNDRLVALAIQKYVSSKVKLKAANVRSLQKRADSLEGLLNVRTYNAAASQQSLLDINPGLRAATAAPEIKTREKATVTAIYTEVVKNLELSKTILNQETPTIEIVDHSSYPLVQDKPSKIVWMVIGAFLASFFFIIILLARHWWRQVA